MYSAFTDEQLNAAKNATLAEYFQTHGFDCELRKNELHVKGFGGFYINTETNEWYCFSKSANNGGRNAVNCLMEMLGMDLKTAVTELSGLPYSRSISYTPTVKQTPDKRELKMPDRADNKKKVFAFLCQTRTIDSKIVEELANDGLLYQDKFGNAVFVHKSEGGEIVGAEIQGTNTYKRFKGVAEGTSDSLFSVKIGQPNKAYIFESAIDLLSFKQLANQEKIQNSVLVSMAGLKPNSLKPLSEKGIRLFSCVDNDDKGIRFTAANGLTPCNRVLAENRVKDFNELLQMIVRNREAAALNPATQKSAHGQSEGKSAPEVKRPRR